MEVGAVKQAFNNEVILLKKNLNQAKIQVIHKLTRKAKTLTEKKVPDKLKAKFTKKSESAVKEVLILKKIKARDVARFIVTHKEELNKYLNRPEVDQDKACARLLLHKALQEKYKLIRDRFSNISIKDLLMSRQERRKLKKEAREKQKNKNKGKEATGPVQAEGDWNVEDINMDDSKSNASVNDSELSAANENDSVGESSDDESENETESVTNPVLKLNSFEKNNVNKKHSHGSDEDSKNLINDDKSHPSEEVDILSKSESELSESDDSSNNDISGKNAPSLIRANNIDNKIVNTKSAVCKTEKINEKINKKQVDKKNKDSHKNKNLKNKILLKNFNKEKSEEQVQENKIVDPFFITATGENYMSLAEPRPPDEVKEVHKQGNRKYRRAVMFGNVPKAKPRRDVFRPDKSNPRLSKYDNSNDNFNSNFRSSNSFAEHKKQKNFDKSVYKSDRGNFKEGRNNKDDINGVSKNEKLHPSWEAKKRQSGILPFQGKKIVFDES